MTSEPDASSWRATCVLLAVSCCASLVAAWWFPYLVTNDGPNHAASISLLLHRDDPGSLFSRYFTVSLGAHATYALHNTLWLWLARALGGDVLSAERVLFSVYVVALPSAVLLLARRGTPGLALLAVPVIFGFCATMGFHAFCFALAPGLLAVVAARAADASSWRVVIAQALLLAVAWWAHVLVASACAVVVAIIHARDITAGRPARWRVALVFLPVAGLAAWDVATGAWEPIAGMEGMWAPPVHEPLPLVVAHLFTELFLVDGPVSILAGALCVVAWALCVVATIRRRGIGAVVEDPLLLAAAVMLVAALVVPSSLPPSALLRCRLVLLAYLVSLGGLELPGERAARRAYWGLAVAAGAMALWGAAAWLGSGSRDVERYVSGIPRVSPHATLLPVHGSTATTLPSAVQHAWGHYTIQRDAVTPQHFAFAGYLPVHFRPAAFHDEVGMVWAWAAREVADEKRCARWLGREEDGRADRACVELGAAYLADALVHVDRFAYVLAWDASASLVLLLERDLGWRRIHEDGPMALWRRP